MPRGGNSQILNLPKADGGLALPALSTLYKQQQVSRHVFRTSQDNCVRTLGVNTRKHHNHKFHPAAVVSDVQADNITSTKRQLKTKVTQHVLAEDSTVRRTHLTSLRVQGKFLRMDGNLAYWSEAVSSLPDREMRFAYNAAIDTLPTNANMALWYRGQVSAQCKLCGTQTLKHVLNSCQVALDQHRFDRRHDSVLSVTNTFITSHVTSQHVLADLPGESYSFPAHIAATEEQPDIVIWNDHQCTLIELTVSFEENFADAERR